MPDIDRAAAIIYKSFIQGDAIDYIKSNLWPNTPEEGYAVQAALLHRMGNEEIKGWKIAATAIAGRPFGKNRMAVAEAEFAFTLGRDLPPKKSEYSSSEIAQSIQSVHAGLEIPDSRFKDFTLPGTGGLIADNACAWKFVMGESTGEKFDAANLADHPTSLIINGKTVTSGTGRDALGGPLSALVWISNTLSQMGIGMKAGQFVTTGVTGLPSPISQGDIVCADLGRYGSASAQLT